MRTRRLLLQQLIAKETDPAKLAELQEELIGVIEEEAKDKALAEMKAQAAADAEAKKVTEASQAAAESAFAGLVTRAPSGIQVMDVVPAEYRGLNLKKTMAWLQGPDAPKALRTRAVENPRATGLVVKLFADMIANAFEGPKLQLKAAMQEGTDSEGGYIVPTEQRMEILAYVRQRSVALRDCRTIPMASDSMTLPRELTQVSVAYTDEESEATEAEPTLEQVTLTAKRMDAYSVSSNELLQDAANPGGIVGLLMDQFTEAIAKKVDSTVFVGTGSPVSGLYLTTGYSETFSTGSSHFSELLEVNLRNLIAKIPTERLAGAKWYGHRSPVWTYAYGLKDSDGRNLFIPSLTDTVPHQLYGWPLEFVEQGKSVSAASTAMLLFGNLLGFFIGERLTRIALFVDPYTRSTKYQTLFLLFTRWAYAHALPNMYGRILTAA